MYQAVATWPRRAVTSFLALASLLLAASPAGAEPPADNGAVFIMYHRFGEGQYASTSIRLDQFEAQIAELTSGRYNVLPVPEIVAALEAGRPLPDRTVGITIDDAYLSVYTQAWPRLRAAGLPFTLFVSTDPLDRGYPAYLNWDQLREMVAAGGVTIGAHTRSHSTMLEQTARQVREELSHPNMRFQEELGLVPELFAYPYGSYSLALRDQVEEAGFSAAFGQHSGATGRTTDRFALPRFPFNETFGDMDRFRLAVNALPLPVVDLTPADPRLDPANNPPFYGFTVVGGIDLGGLSCYAQSQQLVLERLGERRVEVRLPEAFPEGRSRLNCTLPGPGGRWRWLGSQFYVPRGAAG